MLRYVVIKVFVETTLWVTQTRASENRSSRLQRKMLETFLYICFARVAWTCLLIIIVVQTICCDGLKMAPLGG